MRKRTWRTPLVVLAIALAGVVALSGCAATASSASGESTSSSAGNASESSPASASVGASVVNLSIASDSRIHGALSDVEELYSERFPGVSFAESAPEACFDPSVAGNEEHSPDILISDSKDAMEAASSSGSIDETTRFEMLSEDIVFVVRSDSDIEQLTLTDIASGAYSVAVGDDSVLSGNLANQSLSTVGCFIGPDGKTGAVSSGKANSTDVYAGTPLDGKVVVATSDEDACERVKSGEADVAIIRSSIASGFDGVKVAGTVPAQTHASVVYSAAVCAKGAHLEEAQAFLDWANSDADALAVWNEWGISWAS